MNAESRTVTDLISRNADKKSPETRSLELLFDENLEGAFIILIFIKVAS
jgi:hypothetical protein